MAVNRALLDVLIAEHFGTYTAEYRPARLTRPADSPNDSPEAVAARRAVINILDHDEDEPLEAAA